MKGKLHFWGCFISIILAFIVVSPVYGKEDNNKTSDSQRTVIRVAYPLQEGLTEKDAGGNYSGYTYDYLQEIAQYTGWEYEFVEVPGDINEALMTMLDMLSKGEVDLMGGLSKTEQTQTMFDFPEYGYGYSYTNLSVTVDNTEINSTNLPSIKNLRIAVLKKAEVSKGKAKEFCELNNISYSFVECESEEDVHEALENGQADAMLGNDLSQHEGFRTIAQFAGSQFYFAAPKGRTDILNTLNSAILTIQRIKPYFEASLHEQYFANRTYTTYLSSEEEEYIKSVESLKVAVVTNASPIQYKDNKGNVAGISKDIMDRIKQETGLEIEYLTAKSYEEAYTMLDSGKADAICGIPYDYKIAQKHDLILSNRLLEAQVVMVAPNRTLRKDSDIIVAMTKGVELENEKDYKSIERYENVEQCMDAVVTGDADVAYVNLYSAEYLSHNSKYQSLRLIPQSNDSTEFCVGIKKPTDTMIVSIINKALFNIPSADIETIIYQNTAGNYEKVTLLSLIKQNPFASIGIVSGIFVLLGIVGTFILRFTIRTSKQRDIQNKRYMRLSELANEYIYEYDFEKNQLTCSKEFGRLFGVPPIVNDFSEEIKEKLNLVGIKMEADDRFGATATEDEIAEEERLCLLPGGEERWYRNSSVAILDASGKRMYIIGKFTDIQDEKEERERLEKQAHIDGLTGLRNSVSTRDDIKSLMQEQKTVGALLVIDIDKFKDINDHLGHYTGDKVLSHFANMLSDMISDNDVCGRIGGDEFMAYLGDVKDEAEAAQFCDNLCNKAQREYQSEGGANVMITTSVGAVVFGPGECFEDAYKAADKLLYESKNSGRNRYTIQKIND